MSDARAVRLRLLVIPVPDGATEGDASDLIVLAPDARRINRLLKHAA